MFLEITAECVVGACGKKAEGGQSVPGWLELRACQSNF